MTPPEPIPTAHENRGALQQALRSLLDSFPPPAGEALRRGAIPHWFDEVLFARLLESEVDAPGVISLLAGTPLLGRDLQGRYRCPTPLREILLDEWWQERQELFLALNGRAQEYFAGLVEAVPPGEQMSLQREALYHLLVVDEKAGIQQLIDRFEDASGRRMLGSAEDFVTQADELREHLSEEGRSWLSYFHARLDALYQRSSPNGEDFDSLCKSAANPVLQALACWQLGENWRSEHRWSKAATCFQRSLELLGRANASRYAPRVYLSLGKVYHDLATKSSNRLPERLRSHQGIRRLLYVLQHLPFLIYEWMLRRVDFLPSGWYFGTNYQDWVVNDLLSTAARWYRRAEWQFDAMSDRRGLAEARQALADFELEKGRWSRAQGIYAQLTQSPEIVESPYRTARIRLGQSRLLWYQGRFAEAVHAATQALETFRHFGDSKLIGEAASQLGRAALETGDGREAGAAFLEGLTACQRAGDQLLQTRMLWDLELLSQNPVLTPPEREEILQAVNAIDIRCYLARFPHKMLHWFRLIALAALPVSYLMVLVGALILVQSLAIVEVGLVGSLGRLNLGAITASDALILLIGAILPFPFALWTYRFVYSLLGMGWVRLLRRKLVPIEREQPDTIVTDTDGLAIQLGDQESIVRWAWSQVTSVVKIDYHLRTHPIQLISGLLLSGDHSSPRLPVTLEGITTGYEQLKRDLARRLGSTARWRNHDFTILDHRWTPMGLLLSLGYAALVVLLGKTRIEAGLESSSPEDDIVLWFTSILWMFVPTALLLIPSGNLWRLLRHRLKLQRVTNYRPRAFPTWLLWLAAIGSTFFVIAWVIFWLVVKLEA